MEGKFSCFYLKNRKGGKETRDGEKIQHKAQGSQSAGFLDIITEYFHPQSRTQIFLSPVRDISVITEIVYSRKSRKAIISGPERWALK